MLQVVEVVAEAGIPENQIEDMISYIPASRPAGASESPKQSGFNLVSQLTAAKEKVCSLVASSRRQVSC